MIFDLISIKKTELLTFIMIFFGVVGLFFSACNKNKQELDVQASSLREPPPPGQDFFMDVSDYSGINFTQTFGDDELTNVVETVGSGAAFLDYDQDGFLDLYIVNGSYVEEFSDGEKPREMPHNVLYKNLGNGQFVDVTDEAGVGDTGFGVGVTVGDYNNDGFPDIYVSNYAENVLYRNNGDGTFTDVTDDAGIGGHGFSVSAVWFDYDRDGWLDIYVGNYLRYDPKYNLYYTPDGFPGPLNFDGEPDELFHNLGNGKFEDVTESMGLFRKDGRAMGVGSADYNNDGYPDIYVANDQMANYLFRNEEGKGFTEVAMESGAAFNHTGEATSSMSVNFGDYDGNGLLDLFVSDESYSALYTNIGKGRFTDLSYRSGIAIPSGQFTGWASTLIDYNNDMNLDIFKVNGDVQHLYGEEDQLFEYKDDRKYEDVSLSLGPYFKKELVGRGACFGDIDNDGDIDAFISNLSDKPVLLRNDKGNEKNWILIKLVGTTSNRDGMGSRIKLKAGDKVQVIEKNSGGAYLSQNDSRIHFGLGDNPSAEYIEVDWPSGIVQRLDNVEANQIITIQEEKQ